MVVVVVVVVVVLVVVVASSGGSSGPPQTPEISLTVERPQGCGVSRVARRDFN